MKPRPPSDVQLVVGRESATGAWAATGVVGGFLRVADGHHRPLETRVFSPPGG